MAKPGNRRDERGWWMDPPKNANEVIARAEHLIWDGVGCTDGGAWHEVPSRGHGSIGDLLQEILNTKGSNNPSPDSHGVEVKWNDGKSLLTLFHKTPEGGVESIDPFMRAYGWLRKSGYWGLCHTTFNNKSKRFRITLRNGYLNVFPLKKDDGLTIRWDAGQLAKTAIRKLETTLVIGGQKEGGFVRFTNGLLLENIILPDEFISAITGGIVAIDIDANIEAEEVGGTVIHPMDGSTRDHGTKLRIPKKSYNDIWGARRDLIPRPMFSSRKKGLWREPWFAPAKKRQKK